LSRNYQKKNLKFYADKNYNKFCKLSGPHWWCLLWKKAGFSLYCFRHLLTNPSPYKNSHL